MPGDSWHELDTVPLKLTVDGKKKKVKAGADIVGLNSGILYATKGNKTLEFWRYLIPVPVLSGFAPRSGVMAGQTSVSGLRLAIVPNPLTTGVATLRYALSQPGLVTVSLFDVAGRSVWRRQLTACRSGAIGLDLRTLRAGVYLVRMDGANQSVTRKLVVQH